MKRLGGGSVALACLLAAAAAMPDLATGAETAVFEPPQDVVLLWATRASLVVTVISVLLTVFVLVARRHRLVEGQSKWLLFVGLCVLPVPVVFLSSGVGMEESKKVEFCGSCHEPMGPFVENMKDPQSDNLAAVHFKNWLIQRDHCWTCHSDYGVAGTTMAKLRGLSHIFKVTLDDWEPPVELSAPYKWTICLGCHSKSARFKAPPEDPTAHEEVVAGVMKGAVACTECHENAHPPRDARSTR